MRPGTRFAKEDLEGQESQMFGKVWQNSIYVLSLKLFLGEQCHNLVNELLMIDNRLGNVIISPALL